MFLPLLSGCGGAISGGVQKYDPASAAAKAIEIYDSNRDGKLSADELKNSPALAARVRRIDTSGDGILNKEEIQARMEALDAGADLIAMDIRLISNGRPLVGAEVTLTPEPFLGEGYQTFSGTSVEGGVCPLVGNGKRLPGIPAGFYQAKIVHTGQGINVVRGMEIADDTTGNRLEIAL
jgi:hypothetical protein